MLTIIFKIFPPEYSARSIISEFGKTLKSLFIISTNIKPIMPI